MPHRFKKPSADLFKIGVFGFAGSIGVVILIAALVTRPALSDSGTTVSAPRTTGTTTVQAPRGGTSDGKGSNDFSGTSGTCSGGGLTTNCGTYDTKSTCEGASKCAGGLTSGCGKFTTRNGCSSAGNCNGKVGSIGSGCGDFSSSNACTSSHTCKGRTATTSGCKKNGSKSSCEDERKCTGTTFDSKIACPLHKTKSKCKSHNKCRWTRKCDWEPRGCSWKQKDCRWESKGCKWEKSKPRSCDFSKRVARDIWVEFDKRTREAGCLSPGKALKAQDRFPYVDLAPARFGACFISVGKVPGKIAEKMNGFWNSMVKGGWATLGPRRLGVGSEKGTIRLGTKRRFYTDAPINTGELTLSLKKRGGKARTEVTVCLTTADGKTRNIWQFDAARGDDNDGTKWKKTFKDIEGVIAVEINSKDKIKDFQYTIEPKVKPRKYNFGSIKGFADVHSHQMNHIGFGGNMYWGDHTGSIKKALKQCDARDHAIPRKDIIHGKPDPDDVDSWPRWDDMGHQMTHRDWLRRAHEGGLNLMVMLAVNFQPICYSLKAIYPNKNTKLLCGDMDSMRAQFLAAHEFAAKNDWYEIALDPWHARKIIREGKLAVVLGMEASHLFPPGKGDFVDQLDEWRHLGLRALLLAHLTDSRFAGTAPHGEFTLGAANELKYPFRTGFKLDKNGENKIGLTKAGKRMVQAIMDRNMLLDISHLSRKSVQGTFKIAKKNNYYPLYVSHSRFLELVKGPEAKQIEYHLSCKQNRYIEQTGGVIGLRTSNNAYHTYCADGTISKDRDCGASEPVVTNNCDGTSRSFAQLMTFGMDRQSAPLIFGSDTNLVMPGPRFGKYGCLMAKKDSERDRQREAQRKQGRPDGVSETFNIKGYSHVGLLPELKLDLAAIGVDTSGLDGSTEAFLKMWERTWDNKRGKLPATRKCD